MKISIITAVKNDKVNLKKTINSVINQSFFDFEYIIQDGCSTDGTYDFIKSIQDERIKFFSEKDSGLYDALNKGIKNSYGKFILIINAGDVYSDNDVIKNYYQYLESNKFNENIIFYSTLAYCDHNYNILSTSKSPIQDKYFFIRGCDIPHPTTVISRKLYSDLNYYDSDFISLGDYDFLLRAHKRNIQYSEIPITSIHFIPAGISSNIKLLIKESFNVRRKSNISILINLIFTFRSFVYIYFNELLQLILPKKLINRLKLIRRNLRL